MTNVIELHSVSKKYSKSNRFSLEDVSFSIKKGEKLGVFGPNGAGKTTLMSILCRIISQTSGEVNYKSESGNLSNNAFLNSIGYVPQDFSLYAELSPYQNLRYFGTLYGIQKADLAERIDELLTVLGLYHVRHKKIHTFSGGMKRRVNLAIGITLMFLYVFFLKIAEVLGAGADTNSFFMVWFPNIFFGGIAAYLYFTNAKN